MENMINKQDVPNILNAWGGEVNPAIFMFAHQDDETLTFGAEIEAHKAAGRYVIAVLVTDGRSSSSRALTGLSVKDFVQARTLEMLNALSDLGVDEVHLMGAQDGSLTQAQSDAIVTYWYQRFPSASFKVPTDKDDNADHQKIGASWRKIKNQVSASDVRFYVKPEQRPNFPGGYRLTQGGAATLAAAEEYKYVDHDNGRYGIGYLSVPFDFDNFQPISTWHF